MEEDVRFTLRVPRSIHEALGKRAKRERRSFNATVVMALERYLEEGPDVPRKRYVEDILPKDREG